MMSVDIAAVIAKETRRTFCHLVHDRDEEAFFLQWKTPLEGEEGELFDAPTAPVEDIGVEFSGVSNFKADEGAEEYVIGAVDVHLAEDGDVSRALIHVRINEDSFRISFDYSGLCLMKHVNNPRSEQRL